MPDKCRLSESTIAGMVNRRVEPVQRRLLLLLREKKEAARR